MKLRYGATEGHLDILLGCQATDNIEYTSLVFHVVDELYLGLRIEPQYFSELQ